MPATLHSLREQTAFAPKAVDAKAGVIRGVRILGPESKNGRRYSPKAIADAARLYEGVAVNVDHSRDDSDRRVDDAFGWLRNVAIRENAVFGDLHFLRNHPKAALLVEVAVRNPMRLGLSHHADGTVRMDGDVTIVEEIEAVHSVDLVQTPATNRGLFESKGGAPMADKPMTIGSAMRADGKVPPKDMEGLPLREGMDYFESMVYEAMSADPAERQQRLQGVLDSMGDRKMPSVKEAASSAGMGQLLADLAATSAQLNSIVQELSAMNGGEEMSGEAEIGGMEEAATPEAVAMKAEKEVGKPADGEVMESLRKIATGMGALEKRLKTVDDSVARISAEHSARTLLESSGREVTAQRIKALLAAPGSQAELVESWPRAERPGRPAFSPPVGTAVAGPVSYPQSSKEFASALRG